MKKLLTALLATLAVTSFAETTSQTAPAPATEASAAPATTSQQMANSDKGATVAHHHKNHSHAKKANN